MAATQGPSSQTKYEHTDKITNRRKALFPTDDSGSDLGHMSPIHSESSNFSDGAIATLEHEADKRFRKFFKCNLDDYVLLDDNTNDMLTPDPCSETSLPPLYLSSPMRSLLSTPILYSPMHTSKAVTPLGKSPSSSLQTPHDTSTVKVNQKHTKRKATSDAKVPTNESQSPRSKLLKVDANNKSKVRTALFPENELVLPVKTFYPKEIGAFNAKESIAALLAANRTQPSPVKRGKIKKYSNSVPANNKRRYGEINAGVMHKIRKPKQKVTKAKLVKATMKIIEKSPLNEYLEEIANVKKTIKPLPPPQNTSNKENNNTKPSATTSNKGDTLTNRKFFKTIKKNASASPRKQALLETNTQESQDKKAATPPNKRKLSTSAFELSPAKDQTMPEKNKVITDLGVEKDTTTTAVKTKPTVNPNLIFSPTAQMCDMASALDLNSPKRAKLNINKMLQDSTIQRPKVMGSSTEKIEKSAKLFPLFYAENNKSLVPQNQNQKKAVHQAKKFKAVTDNQLLIDAGQKKFGAVECHECSFVYEVGDPSDEMIHRTYHDSVNTFKFNGWKNERVVTNVDLEARVIKIIPSDSKVWWKKGTEVMDFINRELGFYDGILPIDKSQMYLYIKNKKIIGCLTAEMKHTAYKMLPSDLDIDLCSEESFTIRCGISRIWVAPHHRRAGVASQLMDTLRRNFLHGYILNMKEIAMSSPTALGQKFARKYFQTDSFLIYMH